MHCWDLQRWRTPLNGFAKRRRGPRTKWDEWNREIDAQINIEDVAKAVRDRLNDKKNMINKIIRNCDWK